MRIDNWPLDRIMSLPDWCFGRRFLVSCTVKADGITTAFDISEIAFPEYTCVWELCAFCDSVSTDLASFRIALGDQVPPNPDAMSLLEPIFNGLGTQGAGPRAIHMPYVGDMKWQMLRFGIKSMGRRLILEATSVVEKVAIVTVGLVVSSIPKEIPEWLILAADKSPM